MLLFTVLYLMLALQFPLLFCPFIKPHIFFPPSLLMVWLCMLSLEEESTRFKINPESTQYSANVEAKQSSSS